MKPRNLSTFSLSQWPNSQQRLLLDAARFCDQRGAAAWQQWSANHPVETADRGTYALFPAVYENLSQLGYPSQDLAQIRKIYEQTWVRNQLLKHRLKQTLHTLQLASVEAIPLKGMPLALFYHRNLGTRMMSDIDLLVRMEDVPRTYEALRQAGWRTTRTLPDARLFPYLLSDAEPWKHASWQELDLHWQPFNVNCRLEVVEKIWARAVPRRLDELEFKMLDTTDSLILMCYHSRKADTQSTCRWVLDVLALCDSNDPPVQWDCLVQRAIQVGMVLPVRDTLWYLRRELGTAIPQEVVESLERVPVRQHDVRSYRQLARPHCHGSLIKMIATHWWRYRNGSRALGRKAGLFGFMNYLRRYGKYHYQCTASWQVFARLLGLANPSKRAKRHAGSANAASQPV